MPSKPKLIVIVGPTASGKSECAVRLAKKFNGEIVSADSRQIYKGLNIGTGKVPGRWRKVKGRGEFFVYKKIPHHCIDFVPPRRIFTAAEYQQCAKHAIRETARRDALPFLVGGSMFWIDAAVYNLSFPAIKPQEKLRARLAKKNAAELLRILVKLDPERAAAIEQKNPRRLIRAIEIARAFGRVPKLAKKIPAYDALWIGLNPSYEMRSRKIRDRLHARLRMGLIHEAERLHDENVPWKRFYEWGLEYRFLADYLRGKLAKKEMIAALERAINDYARRQMVWWKKNRSIRWVTNYRDAESLLKNFLITPQRVSSRAAS